MRELNINKELPVLAMPNLVLFHGRDITIKLGRELNNEFYEEIAQEDFYAIALTVKKSKSEGTYEKNDFYKVD